MLDNVYKDRVFDVDLHNIVNKIHNDDIIKSLLMKKVEVLNNSEISYLIYGLEIKTVYPPETNELLKQIQEQINNRMQNIIETNLPIENYR